MADECCIGDCECGLTNIPDYKMCKLSQPPNKFNLKKVIDLTSNPDFICKCCGRTANNQKNLCNPAPLSK